MLLVYLAGQTCLGDGGGGDEIAYSEAKALVENNPQTIQNVVFHPRSKRVELELTSGRTVEARYPSDVSAVQFEQLLDEHGVRYESRGSGGSAWWSILTYLLPFVLFFAFWIFVMRRGQGKRPDGRRGQVEAEAHGQADEPGTYQDPYR